MRRPLFGNGIPQEVPATPDLLRVFDTVAMDPPGEQHTYALTLFFWDNAALSSADPSAGSTPTVSLTTNGNVTAYTTLDPTALAAKRLSPRGAALIVDRLVLRGNQQVDVGFLTAESSGFVYGYFEMDGVAPETARYRPLQPGTLVSPFNATPATLVQAAGTSGSVDVHALDPDYLDLLDLKLSATVGAAGPFAGGTIANLSLANASALLLYKPLVDSVLQNDVVFPGIPMRAPSSSTADKKISLTLSVALADVADGAAAAQGFFDRR